LLQRRNAGRGFGSFAIFTGGQHHAKRNGGFALCTINGIALAALVAL